MSPNRYSTNVTLGSDPAVSVESDLYQNFPRMMDSDIIQYGRMEQVGNTAGFIAPGHINGIEGFYNINVNTKTGIIFHRVFYESSRRFQIYIKDSNGKPWYFFKK